MRKLVHLTLLVLLSTATAKAADKYWVGINDNFQQNNNWSLTPGGPGGAGSPGANDVAVFDIASNGFNSIVTINGGQNLQGIRIDGYEGIIVLTTNGTKNLTGFLSSGLPTSIQMNSGIVQIQGTLNATGSIVMANGGILQSQSILNVGGSIILTGGGTISLGNNSTTTLNGNLTVDFDNGSVLNGNTPIVGQTGSTFIFNNNGLTPALVLGNASGTTGINLYNVIINNIAPGNDETLVSTSDIMQVRGTLTLQNGRVNGLGIGNSIGKIRALGNIVATAGFLPSNAQLELGGSTNQTLTFDASVQSNWDGNIIINKTGTPTGSVTLNSTIFLDQNGQTVTFTRGLVNTGTTATGILLQFGDGVTVSGANNSSYVTGRVSKTGTSAFTFPIGDAGFYAPLHIGDDNFADAFEEVRTYHALYRRQNPQLTWPNTNQPPVFGNPPQPYHLSEQEYFILDFVSQFPGFPPPDFPNPTEQPSLWLSYENNRSGGLTSPTQVAPFAWLTNRWENLSNQPPIPETVDGITYIRSNVRAFSVADNNPVFTFGTNNPIANPLPVSWLNFTGRYVNNVVELSWSTAMEQNNDFFTVERSADGIQYTAIGTVKGNGTTSSVSVYNFTDAQPLSGTAHYRIKQTDLDRKYAYSDVIRVNPGAVALKGLRLYPNPAVASVPLTLENSNWRNQKVNVTIYNAIGAIVRQEQVNFGADGRNRISTSGLQKGSYFVNVYYNGEKQTLPFVIQ